jgi:hypothetical protein
MSRYPTQAFYGDTAFMHALAWLCGMRYTSKAPMDRWLKDGHAWRDGPMVLISLPIAIDAWAVASITTDHEQTLEFMMSEFKFCDGPTFSNALSAPAGRA